MSFKPDFSSSGQLPLKWPTSCFLPGFCQKHSAYFLTIHRIISRLKIRRVQIQLHLTFIRLTLSLSVRVYTSMRKAPFDWHSESASCQGKLSLRRDPHQQVPSEGLQKTSVVQVAVENWKNNYFGCLQSKLKCYFESNTFLFYVCNFKYSFRLSTFKS